jgi:hypothetical protein
VPYSPSRIVVSIPAASADGKYYSAYPAGNAPILAAVADDTATGTAALSVKIPLAGASIDASVGLGTLGVGEPLSGAASDSASGSASLTIATPLSGASDDTVSGSATLINQPQLVGSADDTVSGTASLTVGGGSLVLPGLVSNLFLINQAGTEQSNSPPSPPSSTQEFSWNAAAAGSYPVAHYQIQRAPVTGSGIGSYATLGTTTALSYTDTTATNSNIPALTSPAEQYAYRVAAVDTQGNVGPYQSQVTVYFHYQGLTNIGQGASTTADATYSYGITQIFNDTTGNPPVGTYDVLLEFPGGSLGGGGMQPYATSPLAPTYELELGAFTAAGGYFIIDMMVANADIPIGLSHISRLPPGDVYPASTIDNLLSGAYGTFVANQWCTYKAPLSELTMGFTNFTGSISGTTLTCSSTQSGPGVDAGSYITGPGIPEGTYVLSYETSYGNGKFGLGNQLNSITDLSIPAGTQMVCQRTGMYKFDLKVGEGYAAFNLFVNNYGWQT